jgi:hypothetical protein
VCDVSTSNAVWLQYRTNRIEQCNLPGIAVYRICNGPIKFLLYNDAVLSEVPRSACLQRPFLRSGHRRRVCVIEGVRYTNLHYWIRQARWRKIQLNFTKTIIRQLQSACKRLFQSKMCSRINLRSCSTFISTSDQLAPLFTFLSSYHFIVQVYSSSSAKCRQCEQLKFYCNRI